MKSSIFVIFFILTFALSVSANMDCGWTSSKAGVTIQYVAPCDFKNQTTLESILNKVVSLLNRQDTSLKIWALVSQHQLSFPGGKFSNFFSIGYNTLRLIDGDFLFDFYQSQTIASEDANNGANKFESRLMPIDINSTNSKTNNEVGIKIIYDKDYRLGGPDWADITKAIVYAAKNVNILKKQQIRDTVRYNINGWYVSLVTLDTFNINKILGKEPVKSVTQITDAAATNNSYFIIWGIGLLLVLGLLFVRLKHSRLHGTSAIGEDE